MRGTFNEVISIFYLILKKSKQRHKQANYLHKYESVLKDTNVEGRRQSARRRTLKDNEIPTDDVRSVPATLFS